MVTPLPRHANCEDRGRPWSCAVAAMELRHPPHVTTAQHYLSNCPSCAWTDFLDALHAQETEDALRRERGWVPVENAYAHVVTALPGETGCPVCGFAPIVYKGVTMRPFVDVGAERVCLPCWRKVGAEAWWDALRAWRSSLKSLVAIFPVPEAVALYVLSTKARAGDSPFVRHAR